LPDADRLLREQAFRPRSNQVWIGPLPGHPELRIERQSRGQPPDQTAAAQHVCQQRLGGGSAGRLFPASNESRDPV